LGTDQGICLLASCDIVQRASFNRHMGCKRDDLLDS
jgi:hypothetical protein